MAYGEAIADGPDEVGAEDAAVVGQETAWSDAVGAKPGKGPLEKGRGVLLFFGIQRLDVTEPGMVIDADIDVLPADSSGAAGAVSGDPMTDETWRDPTELLDVHVEQVTRVRHFIADHGFGRLQRPQATQAGLAENPADGRSRQPQYLGHLPPHQTFTS